MVINKHFLPQTDDFKNQQNILIKGLVQFFHNNQYDEEKYPTFRSCDLQTLEGDLIYTFYDCNGGYNYIYDDTVGNMVELFTKLIFILDE